VFKVLKLSQGRCNIPTVILVMTVMFSIVLTGCGSGSSIEITPEKGGTHAFGQIQIIFPPDSVDGSVIVSGETVTLNGLPGHIIPLSQIHAVSLSNPEFYNARTATVIFTLAGNLGTANIFHSKDGENWENLVGDIDGNTISSKISSFSFLMVASFSGLSSTLYSLAVQNDSPQDGAFCIFQRNSELSTSTLSTAWLTRTAAPDTSVNFNWTDDYSFTWSETDSLFPGIIFNTAQIVSANLTSENQIHFGFTSSGFAFSGQTQGSQEGMLYIEQDVTVPFNTAAIGIARSGSPIFVTQAEPNVVTAFNPSDSTYFIAFGNFTHGELLDTESIENSAELVFPPDVYNLNVVLNEDDTWTIVAD